MAKSIPQGKIATRADLAEAIAKVARTTFRETVPVTADGSLPEAGTPLDKAKRDSFRNPMSTPGDIIVGGEGGGPVRVGIGLEDEVLTVVDIGGGELRPRWATATGGGGGGAGGFSIHWVFDTTTTVADPGSGNLRLNNATQSSATIVVVDALDANATDWTDAINTFDDSTSTINGHLFLFGMDAPENWMLFTVGAVTDHTGWLEIAVTFVDSSSASPFAASDDVMVSFVRTGDKGDTGTAGADGTDGVDGGGVTIRYLFSTTTTNSDPGSGNLRLNNATQSSATAIYLDDLDVGATDWSTVIATFDDSTNTLKGHLHLFKTDDLTKWIVFSVSAYTSHSGYRELTVAVVGSSTSNPFADTDPVTISFTRTGDAGSAGVAGTTGPVGGGVAIDYTFSTTTTNSDPGNGVLRLDNATQNLSTTIRADLLDTHGSTVTTILDSLDDSTNLTVKGHIRLVKTDDPSKWILFTVSAVDSSSGYRNITVVVVASSTASPFANSDLITLTFTRAGDIGPGATFNMQWTISEGGVPTTGVKYCLQSPVAGTATAVYVGADVSGDLTLDFWKDTHANWRPTDSDSMPGAGTHPVLSGASSGSQTDLTGGGANWTTRSISAHDWICLEVESAATITEFTAVLDIART